MKTRSLRKDGFCITYTADGENYRYVIQAGQPGHIYQAGHGAGSEDKIQPTIANMTKTLDQWLRLAKPRQSE